MVMPSIYIPEKTGPFRYVRNRLVGVCDATLSVVNVDQGGECRSLVGTLGIPPQAQETQIQVKYHTCILPRWLDMHLLTGRYCTSYPLTCSPLTV